MQRFTKALKGFANLCPYIEVLNPEELLNASGRLLRKVEGQTKEMIFYVPFRKEVNPLHSYLI